tara:strand:- start:38367 stop:39395 length:1029 start_codon:yes stop_codon:yes gene_type:complete
MNIIKLEYIWLDGYVTKNLRSKTKILQDREFIGDQIDLHHLPKWTFDGSSTRQAKGKTSDCILVPVRMIKDPERKNAYLVLCEVCNSDNSKHSSNSRVSVDQDWWFGFEQEYVFYDLKKKNILGWPDDKSTTPAPQGEYYCGVGVSNVAGREIVEAHLDACLKAGLSISGVNAEVMLGQWEYQLFGKGTDAADDLWLSRYLLHRIAEKYGVGVDLRPKPMTGDWNGSGMHINFSNSYMRNLGGLDMMKDICLKLEDSHEEFIKHYGEDNKLRLTGEYETQHIDKFSYGISDRGASIRIPLGVANDSFRGYLEDRRPAANADPYKLIDLVSNLLKIKETYEVL